MVWLYPPRLLAWLVSLHSKSFHYTWDGTASLRLLSNRSPSMYDPACRAFPTELSFSSMPFPRKPCAQASAFPVKGLRFAPINANPAPLTARAAERKPAARKGIYSSWPQSAAKEGKQPTNRFEEKKE
jgi:hypothetical protein